MAAKIIKRGTICLSVLIIIFTLFGQISRTQSQFEAIKHDDIKSANLSSSRIPGQNLTPNTIIIFRTNEGRFGKLLIKSSNPDLILEWVTFSAEGSIHSSGDNLRIRKTYTCDLDAGRESRTSADFWWQIATATERFLTPQNGATFAIYTGLSEAPAKPVTGGQQVKTSATDTSKTVESARQAEKASKIRITEKLAGLIKESKQLPSQITQTTGEAPAVFKNVKYRFKPEVVRISGEESQKFNSNLKVAEEVTQRKTLNLTPKTRIQQGALIETGLVTRLEEAAVIFDETSKLAARVAGRTSLMNRDYMVLTRPEIHEVLDEFEIPQQTVRLTSGNITPLTSSAVQFQYRRTSSNVLSPTSGERWHIKDPWLKITFNDVPLVAYSSEGRSISVRLSGRIGLTPIDVDGRYSGFSGYEFKVRSGEEVSLKVTVGMNIKEDLKIPLFAIDIPAGIATVRGGFYLLIGVDGSFTLVAEATEWLEAEAGVRGGTFLWIPTGFQPFFNLNKGFEAETHFAGQVNGYVKAGPLLEIELCGFDLVGAGGLVGLGVDCETLGSGSDSILDVDIYGSIEIYATLLGWRINFVNNTFNLYHLQKPNTYGYDITYNEACAWRNTVWGEIRKDTGTGQLVPVTDTPLIIEVKRSTQNQQIEKFSVRSDADGNFRVDIPFELYNGDTIRLIQVGSLQINSARVFPTLPFNKVRIEYADFFNDVCRGQVAPVQVKNWSTGEWEYLFYNKNVRLNSGAQATCDNDGNFLIPYDFKPGQKVIASIDHKGFVVNSPAAQTDIALMGKRVKEISDLSYYTDSSGRLVEKRVDKEYFQVINLRGEKQVILPADYLANYFHYVTLSRVYEYFTGKPITPPVLLGTRNYRFSLSPLDKGISAIAQDFTEEWSWLGDGSATRPTGRNLEVQKAAGVVSQARPEFKASKAAQLMTGSAPFFRYDSDKTRAQGSPIDEGVRSIVRIGKINIVYEGAQIEVEDLRDKQQGEAHELPTAGPNPGMQEFLDRISSRINPARLSKLDPISSRINVPLNKIRISREIR